MNELTDLEHIRTRPTMYVGCTTTRGLHHLFDELLDNTIDQFLAGKATTVRVAVDGEFLEFVDDGPGLPFDLPDEAEQSLATNYLTKIRTHRPTADGHTPHVHVNGWGCGLSIVTALTNTCEVHSWRDGKLWQQSFSKGMENAPAKIVGHETHCGTNFRMSVDRDIFSADWSADWIKERLTCAAYLFPGLRVKTPDWSFCANRGLADWAEELASAGEASDPNHVWWINGLFGDIHIQAALAGTTAGRTQWRPFANGSASVEKGSHLTALKQVVSACKLAPAVAMIHVIMQSPRFAGPTLTKLDVPEIIWPIYRALKPDLERFSASL